jgi:hypothetical protein
VARIQESHKGHDIVIEEPEGERRRVLDMVTEEPGGERRVLDIVIEEPGGERRVLEAAVQEPRLFIDEQPVNVIQNPDGTYSSEGVFYAKYASLLDLARASIDIHRPEG